MMVIYSRISSEVVIGTPNGDIGLYRRVYREANGLLYMFWALHYPAKPTSPVYPPLVGLKPFSNRTSNTRTFYCSAGTLDPVTNQLVSGN